MYVAYVCDGQDDDAPPAITKDALVWWRKENLHEALNPAYLSAPARGG